MRYRGRDILLHTISQAIKITVAVFTSTCSFQCQTMAYYPLARKGNKHESAHGAFLQAKPGRGPVISAHILFAGNQSQCQNYLFVCLCLIFNYILHSTFFLY